MRWLKVGFIFGTVNRVGGDRVAAAREPSVVYSSPRYSEEAGDLVGMAIELHEPSPAHVVVLVEGAAEALVYDELARGWAKREEAPTSLHEPPTLPAELQLL